MEFLVTFLLIFAPPFVLNDLIALKVYGGFVSKTESARLMNFDIKKLRTGEEDTTILIHEPYISTLSFLISGKYYVQNYGIVPRWSKLHKRIDEYFMFAAINKDRPIIDEPIFHKTDPERVSD